MENLLFVQMIKKKDEIEPVPPFRIRKLKIPPKLIASNWNSIYAKISKARGANES